jgi:hypothetical protein
MRADLEDAADGALQWVWSGPGAADERCTAAVQEALELGPSAAFLSHDRPESFLARAVAVRALRGGPLRCNLRVGELTHPQQSMIEASTRVRVAASYLVFGLLLCVLNMAWWGLLQHREARVQRSLTELARELAGNPSVPRGQEVLVARRSLERQRPLNAAFLAAFQPSLTVRLADVLETAHAEHIALETLSLRGDFISMHGTSDSWSGGQKLEALLSSSGFSVDLERRDAGADERVHFSITGVPAHE